MLIRFCRRRVQALALTAALAPAAATAATITVTTTADGSLPDQCTLRDATAAANTNAAVGGCAAGDPGHDDIVFAPGVGGTLLLSDGQIVLSDEMSITGPGADALTLDAQSQSRIFDILGDQDTPRQFTLAGMTLTHGRTTDPDADGHGGAIRSMSALHLVDVVLAGNSIAGDNAVGGALFSMTTTVLTRTRVVGNWTEGYGGIAGGVMVAFGSAELADSTIADNWTVGDYAGGGGIVVFWAWFDATIVNSTISGNQTRGNSSQGGGLATGGNVFLTNSTLSGNRTFGDNSGDGFTDAGALTTNGNVTMINSTVFDNASSSGVTINLSRPADTTLSISNSLVANPTGALPLCSKAIDGAGSVANLIGDASCGTDTLVGGAPVVAEALALAPLADNGGPTWTHALLPGSPAIDAGDPAACAAAPVNNLDQRGRPRPQDGNGDGTAACDIGAFEAADADRVFADGFDPAAR